MNVLLGITGGVAAFKSAALVRVLRDSGMNVRVVMTRSATEFMTPLMFQALSGYPVRIDLFDTDAENAMGHIEFARWADLLLVAPATANAIAKLAHGLADDLLTTLALVFEGPVIICPSMNHSMWDHPSTVHNCELLHQRGVVILGPNEGEQACGEYGYGRMVEVEDIVQAVKQHTSLTCLAGYHVVITAGPTRESIDPVRYISNNSSGKMGFALAEAALSAGAIVTLISGPVALRPPKGVNFVPVISAKDMYTATMSAIGSHPKSIFIGAAAVADYRVSQPLSSKLKKTTSSTLTLKLELNPDIVSEVVKSKQALYVVGFAAETEQVLSYAKEKLVRKKLDMIVANRVGPGLGFEVDENEVQVLTTTNQWTLPRASKKDIALNLIAIITSSLQNACFKIAETGRAHATQSTN